MGVVRVRTPVENPRVLSNPVLRESMDPAIPVLTVESTVVPKLMLVAYCNVEPEAHATVEVV